MRTAVVSIKNLTKRQQGRLIVDHVSFEVYESEIFALIGPNGSGKTTIVETLVGVRHGHEGEITIFGMRPDRSEVRKKIGVQFENSFLVWNLKLAEMMTLFGSLYPHTADLATLMDDFGLGDKKDCYLRKLSKGERQRASICAAFVGNPRLLILDEPTSGLSPEIRAELWSILLREREKGKTIIFTTHYLEEAEKWADRIALVRDGRIIVTGRPAELIDRMVGTRHKVVVPRNCSMTVTSESKIPAVSKIAQRSFELVLYSDDPKVTASFLLEKGTSDIRIADVSLEDVYFEATGETYVADKRFLESYRD